MKTYTGFITKLEPNQVFVYGANTKFIHGAGAAKQALKFGAIYRKIQPNQVVGQTWGIITKDLDKGMRSISKQQIVDQIRELYEYAIKHPELEFLVAYSGTGKNLNGYSNEEMTEMFCRAAFWFTSSEYDGPMLGIPINIVFEQTFFDLINEKHMKYEYDGDI